jgi:hypothetical protein
MFSFSSGPKVREREDGDLVTGLQRYVTHDVSVAVSLLPA